MAENNFIKSIRNQVKKLSSKGNKKSEEIYYTNLYAYKQDIKEWVDGRIWALDAQLPDWAGHIRVLDDVMIDAHINGIIAAIKNKIKAKRYAIYNSAGEIDEESTNIFEKKWFFNFIDYVIEAHFYPYSLIEMGEVENESFNEMMLIPREYVTPQNCFIKKNLYSTSNTPGNGWQFDSPELAPYYIYLQSPYKLGLLDIAAPHALFKKHMMIYWNRYAEKFSLPFRKGQTDIKDNERRQNMENMFKNWGNNMWAVFDNDDKVDLQMTANTDVYKVYLEQMKFSNNEISKAFAGAVGIFDEKSYVGSSEAGERMFNEFIIAFSRDVAFATNDELIPRMMKYYGFKLPVGSYFGWVNETSVSYQDNLKAAEIISKMLGAKMDAEEIYEKLGYTVTFDKGMSSEGVIPAIENAYKGLIDKQEILKKWQERSQKSTTN